MSPTTARQELHQLIDRLDEPRVKRVLRLVKTEATEERPWPRSVGAGHSGLGDVASNPEKYLTDDFGR